MKRKISLPPCSLAAGAAALLLLASAGVHAQELREPGPADDPPAATQSEQAEEPAQLGGVVVTGVRQRLIQAGVLADVIEKTELIGRETIESRQAVNLVEAIADSPGVRISNECSMCAVKRVMLNGMRGEQTTILVDGLPLYTMLAGFYALDALVTTGIERIEIARGSGASLLAPEALGGTINIVSREPRETGLELDLSSGSYGSYLGSGFGSLVSDDGSTRASMAVQFNERPQIDLDRNRVSEQPRQDTRSVILRLSKDFGLRDNLVLRGAYTEFEIFGGPTSVSNIGQVLAGFDGIESPQLFEGDDVRERYLGKPWETTEWIDTTRTELSATWLREFNWRYNASVSVAATKHEQDSFYEGFDYVADNDLLYFEVRNNYVLNDAHLLTFGLDVRTEELRSESEAGNASPNYIEDSFDYDVAGLFIKDTWNVTDALEIALAVRFDQVTADFVAPEKPGTEIDELIVAPRVDMRLRHGSDWQWSSRLSVGRGYRAPLSFFESDHGILDAGDGFAIDIDELEDSLSTNYALSYEGERLTATASLAYTRVDNLAAIDETPDGVPLLTQLDETASVVAADIALGYRIGEALTLGATLENFEYNDAFKGSFGVAPFEQRAVFTADYRRGPWHVYSTAAWVGSRDLEDYGYEGFNVLGSGVQKSTDAPSFWTVDLRIAREFGDRYTVYAGASNLFDKTQVNDMDTPLFWDADGGYDVAYIYGPLRGREVYAGVQMQF